MIDYTAIQSRDIILDIFDETWAWKGQRRINNVDGSFTWVGSLSYNTISTSTARVKVSLLPRGGSWTQAVEVGYLNVDVQQTSAPNPNLEFNLWTGTTAGPGVTLHQTWGVSGLGPGRWLRLDDVDLATGYNRFSFQYSTTQSGRFEIRLGSPSGQLLGICNFTSSGGWAKSSADWTGATLQPVGGTHDIYLLMKAGNLNAFRCQLRDE